MRFCACRISCNFGMDMGRASLSVLVLGIQHCYRESYSTRMSEVKSQSGQGCYEAGSLLE
jgi:hypothetical protein